MFIHRSSVLKLFTPLRVAAFWMISVGLSTVLAEPIQFSNEQKPSPGAAAKKEAVATEEKVPTSKFFRPYRPADTVSGSVESPFSTPVVQPQSSAPPSRTSRQADDLLDRRRNWIFAEPGDGGKKQTADEALGIDDFATGSKKSQGVIGRFLESKKQIDPKANGLDRNRPGALKELGFHTEVGFDDDQRFQKEEIKETKASAGPQQSLRVPGLSGVGAEQSRLAEIWMEQHGPEAKRIREEKQMRMNEFESLFGPTGQTAPGVNSLSDVGAQQAISPLSPSSGLNTLPPVSQIPEPSRSARALSVSSGPTLPDVNARVFGPSSVGTPLPQPQRVQSQPAILPFPKRRF